MRYAYCTNKSSVVLWPLWIQLERVLEVHSDLTMHRIACAQA